MKTKQVVIVVGNSSSGQDISMELIGVAKEVHLSVKSLQISEGLAKVVLKNPNLHIHLEVKIYPFFVAYGASVPTLYLRIKCYKH